MLQHEFFFADGGPLALPPLTPSGRSLLTLLCFLLVPLLVPSFNFGVGGSRLSALSSLAILSVVLFRFLGTHLPFSALVS